MERQVRIDRAHLIDSLMTGEEIELEMGHLGRLRLFELQNQLRATRLREAFGILFDGRHVERDVAEKAVSGMGDAYRKGGDEVVVIMPGTPLAEARRCMRGALVSLSKEEISVRGVRRRLSSACGLVAVAYPQTEAEAEIQRADHLQKEAKTASKRPDGSRSSALAVQGEKVELLES